MEVLRPPSEAQPPPHSYRALTDPVLHVQSTVYLDDDRPIRWTDNYFHEEKYEYFASFDWSDPSAHVAGEAVTRASSPNRSKHDMLEAL
jgi:hypothetical protein